MIPLIEELTPPIQNVIRKTQQILSHYFQTSLQVKKVAQLSEPDRRNLILRVNIHSPGDKVPATFIVKKTTLEVRGETDQEQMSRFARDWAGIEFLTKIRSQHAPYFYGVDLEDQFIVIEDLGEPHHSLVGPLTRPHSPENAQQAIEALEIYCQRVGQMHADTFGKTNEFNKLLLKIYPKAIRLHFLNEEDFIKVSDRFERFTHHDSLDLKKELAHIQDTLSSTDFKVLLHGDICPDNVYFQQSHMQIIDFEYGDVGNALIDGVYLRMGMPSCWCSKTLPENILLKMESIYFNALKTKLSHITEPAHAKMMVYACAYWLIRTINWHAEELEDHDIICPSGPVDSNSAWQPEKNAFRPRLLSRLKSFIDLANEYKLLPLLTHASVNLLNSLQRKWPTTDFMERYPVFKNADETTSSKRSLSD